MPKPRLQDEDGMEILGKIIEQAQGKKGAAVFAEGDEERTLEAASRLARDGVCRAFVVAVDPAVVKETARRRGLDISHVTITAPSADKLDQNVLDRFIKSRTAKGLTENQAGILALSPLYFSALFLESGKADTCIAGARTDTADVIRAALHCVGTSSDVKLISSFFIMMPPPGHPVCGEPVLFSDCAVNPEPGAPELRDIAVETIKTFKRLFPQRAARAAFLSFSTKGSAKYPGLIKVQEAAEAARGFFAGDPSVMIDGELQFDAAVVPEISKRKSPGSPLEGKANIFIFPDLNSGNIGYKLAERFGGFKALGPVLQGVARPFSDLSRGCSADDIYYITAITLLGAKGRIK